LQVEELESRQLLSGFQPTAAEQLFLEQLNDARANPAAYGASIGLNLSGVAPSQPLAFDTRIVQAARVDAYDMSARAFFDHVNPDGNGPGQRLTLAGFPWTSYGESIAAGTVFPTTASALAALIIDTGVSDLGHRHHLLAMDPIFQGQNQVGIGVLQGGTGPYTNYYVIDSASSPDTRPFITGVVFNDVNGNGKYDIGEGLGGVTITAAGAGATTTWDSGGYSLRVNPGVYTVTASGGPLAAPLTFTVGVGATNARVNFNGNAAVLASFGAWITRLYRDLLGRAPSAADLGTWVGALEAGASRQAVVAGFLGSAEYNQRLVTQWFQKFLGRTPGPAGMGMATAMQLGVSQTAIKQAILSSPEYLAKHGGTALGMVQGLFNDLLGRPFTDNASNFWVQRAATGNAAWTVASILASTEYKIDEVTDYYNYFLRRQADSAGLGIFANAMVAGLPERSVLVILLSSDEYYLNASR
jgi:uncharacterized protein YkwD